jgi:hypothetical protein
MWRHSDLAELGVSEITEVRESILACLTIFVPVCLLLNEYNSA